MEVGFVDGHHKTSLTARRLRVNIRPQVHFILLSTPRRLHLIIQQKVHSNDIPRLTSLMNRRPTPLISIIDIRTVLQKELKNILSKFNFRLRLNRLIRIEILAHLTSIN